MNTPHKHASFIKAWADGATIQVFNRHAVHEVDRRWITLDQPGGGSQPSWSTDSEYRIKPDPVTRYCPVFQMPAGAVIVGHSVISPADAAHHGHRDRHGTDKLVGVLHVILDPETHTLVSASVEKPCL